jgi:nucleotide-binding universal stress UspA family protein
MVDQDDSGPRIVVALDRSEHSRQALRRGSIEAGDHDGRLEVLRAWTYLDQPGPGFDPNYGEAKVRDEVARTVDEVLGADRPANTTLLIVNDLPGRAILEAANGAFVVVLGARGVGGFAGLRIGSVSRHVVNHASCPVLIVR